MKYTIEYLVAENFCQEISQFFENADDPGPLSVAEASSLTTLLSSPARSRVAWRIQVEGSSLNLSWPVRDLSVAGILQQRLASVRLATLKEVQFMDSQEDLLNKFSTLLTEAFFDRIQVRAPSGRLFWGPTSLSQKEPDMLAPDRKSTSSSAGQETLLHLLARSGILPPPEPLELGSTVEEANVHPMLVPNPHNQTAIDVY